MNHSSSSVPSRPSLSCILTLKKEGNEFFKKATNIPPSCSVQRQQMLMEACGRYGRALETVVVLEHHIEGVEEDEEDDEEDDARNQLFDMKTNLFLNLAMTNYQLGDYTESRKCCNAVVVFLNDPHLPMNDLGEKYNIKEDQEILGPVAPSRNKIVAKVLFRRAKALLGLSCFDLALSDVTHASQLLPSNKDISACVEDVQKKVSSLNKSLETRYDTTHEWKEDENAEDHGGDNFILSINHDLCNNGGYCLLHRALWSQMIREASVYIPIPFLLASLNSHMEILKHQCFHIYFSVKSCDISLKSKQKIVESSSKGDNEIDDNKLFLSLAYNIVPADSSWFREDIDGAEYLVVVFAKVTPLNIFPGCEWWERVFDDDEKIDTMTCSVGAATSQLPDHARQRAAQEHARFQALDSKEQVQELEILKNYKKMFNKAEASARPQVVVEEKAIHDVPQRGPMLDALRSEFPNIHFTAK